MAQLALYRKYRSQSFEDLIGQDHIVRTLQSALASGRIAQTFLFTGPRGTGKTSCARLLAKALNCENPPSNDCDHCRMITAGSHPDVIEMDAASDSGVEDVREKIVEVVSYAPMMGKYKVFIIDEVHDLSPKAFDALLKTIEEPPPHLVFILATTEFNKVPATIRSRCQKYEFHRASLKHISERLQHVCKLEEITAEPAAIAAIARMADGGFRDALTLLEQAILVSDGTISVDVVYDQLGLVSEQAVDELLLSIQSGDVPNVIAILEKVTRSGRDPRALLESMLHRLADLTRVIYQVQSDDSDATRDSAMYEMAARLGRPFLIGVRTSLAEAHKIIRDISLPRLWLESELIRLTTLKELSSKKADPVKTSPAASQVQPPVQAKQEPPRIPDQKVEDIVPVVEVATAEPTVTTNFGAAANDWQKLILALPLNPATGNPVLHKLKLASSSMIEDNGSTIKVAFDSQMDYNWFVDKPDRIKFLSDLLPKIGREGTTLEFVVEKKNESKLTESEAVELPVDGARLERIVRDVFNVPDNRDSDI